MRDLEVCRCLCSLFTIGNFGPLYRYPFFLFLQYVHMEHRNQSCGKSTCKRFCISSLPPLPRRLDDLSTRVPSSETHQTTHLPSSNDINIFGVSKQNNQRTSLNIHLHSTTIANLPESPLSEPLTIITETRTGKVEM
jgi:hypothetical protein